MNSSDLVKSTSRSFALSLLWLPKRQRSAVGLSYLLARLADTITDSGSWTSDERLIHHERLEKAILGGDFRQWSLTGALSSFSKEELALLNSAPDLLRSFNSLPTHQQGIAREVLQTLMGAMKWDLETFSGEKRPAFGVRDVEALDAYCYSIAGCVGKFWTQIFELPLRLEESAIAYGRGLQRINILRDVKEDWERGRVYLPANLLEVFELGAAEPWKQAGWSDFCHTYIEQARELLLRGAEFCDQIPRRKIRLRFASMMPLMIGMKTLRALEDAKSWNNRIKISRPAVKRLAMLALIKSGFGRRITPWARRFVR